MEKRKVFFICCLIISLNQLIIDKYVSYSAESGIQFVIKEIFTKFHFYTAFLCCQKRTKSGRMYFLIKHLLSFGYIRPASITVN